MDSLEVEAKNISKTYGDRKVVKDVSLSVKTSEVVGLLGPNGAGKTTSFYMIVGLVKANGGSIHLGDKEITNDPLYKRAVNGIRLPSSKRSFCFQRVDCQRKYLRSGRGKRLFQK